MNGTILETIGSPLVEVSSPEGATIAAKIESKNPGGSAKDRPALAMIEAAERAGEISPGDSLVEPTSGNTGIGLAMVSAAKGYDLTIVMSESASPERRDIMRAYGADIELVAGDISEAKDRADELEAEGMTQLRQFENAANPRAHYRTTAEEILEQVGDREIDAFVAGVGTGGTLSGNGRRLREEFPEMDVVAVEPAENAVLSTGEPGHDDFQGMGPGFVSPNLDRDLLDGIETVTLEDAEAECRRLAREEGILVGQSSGASYLAARRVAERLATPEADCPESPDGYVIENAPANDDGAADDEPAADARVDGGSAADGSGDTGTAPDTGTGTDDCPLVVTVFWDSGERYMSTGMFD
ncbi:PLP-dependent cysteine synthase family protein [Halogeometricum limi]|uniref:Cysteine synthase A n=1 Tax=Halogeometricum limi TaxID=555875 RepID=A0A1I6IQP0_9EURY|nr:PLP-dependent cysteine synthase family protein [Halogeometricum limi]SFR69062.1 cysteine synthase A [Halogeometricum limi]